MQIIHDLTGTSIPGPTVLTNGNFDGLHRGHRALLEKVQTLASAYGDSAKSAILTFDPHPLAILRPGYTLQLLTTPIERLHLAADLGIDLGILQPFTGDFAALSPADFMRLLKRALGLKVLMVGPDFALGRNRSGDLPTLAALGTELGYRVEVIEPVDWHGRSVRSSVIRTLIEEGEVSAAAELLGRHYSMTSQVVEGDHRGRTIGFPTANLQPPANKLLPANGVYATIAHLDQQPNQPIFASVTNIGVRPTVDGINLHIEPHLLDFPSAGVSDNLYGQTLTLEFVARLRGEQRFPNLDTLKAQIAADVHAARLVL